MSTVMVPANAGEALGMLESAAWFLAGLEAADIPAEGPCRVPAQDGTGRRGAGGGAGRVPGRV